MQRPSQDPKRILITGARGFIGRALYPKVRAAFPRAAIVAVGRTPATAPQDPPGLALDLTDPNAWRSLGDGFDIIYHLAAVLPDKRKGDSYDAVFLKNTSMANGLYEACQQWKPSALVYSSSISVYPMDAGKALDETIAPSPASLYGAAKVSGEHFCSLCAPHCGQVAMLRLSSVYGPHKSSRDKGVIDIFVERALAKQPPVVFGKGERTQDFIYVTDAAEAFIKATLHNASGVFNVGSGRPVSMRELAQTVVDVIAPGTLTPQTNPGAPEDPSIRLDVSRAKDSFRHCSDVTLQTGIQLLAAALTHKDPPPADAAIS